MTGRKAEMTAVISSASGRMTSAAFSWTDLWGR
jgi:hypothetical protein